MTPEIRQAMLAGHIGRWQITGGMLVLAHEDMPNTENLQPRADALVHLGRTLSDGFGAVD